MYQKIRVSKYVLVCIQEIFKVLLDYNIGFTKKNQTCFQCLIDFQEPPVKSQKSIPLQKQF